MITPERKAKITWHCRRGMLELDLIFQRFVKHLDQLSEEQLMCFEKLLKYPDPDLFAWLMGYEKPSEQEIVEIVKYIQLHHHT